MFDFVVLPGFSKAWRKLKIGQSAFETLLVELSENPEAGDVIPGGDGLRKLRIKLPDRGKRGGGRVIYALFQRRTRTYWQRSIPSRSVKTSVRQNWMS